MITDTWIGIGFIAMIAAALGLFGVAIVADRDEARQWEVFRTTHQCRVTQTMPGESFTGVGTNGQLVVGNTSSKQAWSCNDGVTYWRNK